MSSLFAVDAVDEKVLDRIWKLVMLASSPAQHEASAAALMACRMIRDNEVVLTNAHALDAIEDRVVSHVNEVNKLKQVTAAQVTEIRRLEAEVSRLLREGRVMATPARPLPPPQRRRIVSRFSGLCLECGEPYDVGEAVLWTAG